MSRAQLAADTIRVYSVSTTVRPPSARQTVQEHVDDFHGDPEIQERCRRVTANQDKFTEVIETPHGRGLGARCRIPAGTELVLYSGAIVVAGDQLGRHELGFGAGILASPLAIDGSQEGGGPRTGQMQWANHACIHPSRPPPKGPNCRAVDVESGHSSLCLWILVADREIEPEEHLLFAYQRWFSRTSFWKTAATVGPCPRGYITIACGCSAPLACPCGGMRHEPPPAGGPAAGGARRLLVPAPPTTVPPILGPPLAVLPIPAPAAAPPPIPPPPIPLPPGGAGDRGSWGVGGMEDCALHVAVPAPESASCIRSINVGPVGMREALPSLVYHFRDLPAVVMLQECHLPATLLADTRRLVHRLLPAYSMFASRSKSAAGNIQVVTLVHVYLAARATLLEITEQLKTVESPPPALLAHVHALRIIEPRTGTSILAINVRQFQASQPAEQAALLDLAGRVVRRWADSSDAVICGGDWNASLLPRIGYNGTEHIRRADVGLEAWSRGLGLSCAAPKEHTWASFNESRRAVLDCFFYRSKTGQTCLGDTTAFNAADVRLDHKGISARLNIEGISAMLPLEALMKPVRLNMRAWRSRADTWNKLVSEAVQDEARRRVGIIGAEGDDCFQRLDRCKHIVLSSAETILGVTGGKMRSFIPFHSSSFIQLTARLRLVKAALRDVYARQALVDVRLVPSKAMRRVWDAGWYPHPASYATLSTLWTLQSQGWTRDWLRQLRQLSASITDQVAALRQSELSAAAKRRRQEAIDRFWSGRELRKLLHPATLALHTPALRTSIPNSFVATGTGPQLSRLQSGLEGLGLAGKVARDSSGNLVIDNLCPSEVAPALAVVAESGTKSGMLEGREQVVTTAHDRLVVIEYNLALEGTAKKSLCPSCRGSALLPVSVQRNGARTMSTWCQDCCGMVVPVVDAVEYEHLLFMPASAVIPRIPSAAQESLRDPVSAEDLEFLLGQLPNGKAAEIPYELWKRAPEAIKECLRECLNEILVQKARPPQSWLGGLVRFLFKKGDPLAISCYRPVCLLDTAYKILSALVTDRLTRMCERHGLQDASQEGFRRLRSTQRQVQSLHWVIEDVAEKKGKLYLTYMDFDTAFNSPDHEGLWQWMRKLNIPDVDLLQSLYQEAHYMADLPYGRSAPVFLTRGGKQGDKLSPQLFNLLFFALLLALRAAGVGFQLVTGMRSPARGFADDLTLICNSAAGMSRLVQVVADFCNWSGMRIKIAKSVITAYDYSTRCDLPTDDILYQGQALTRLPADESFPYLGIRASLVPTGRRRGPGSSPGLTAEKEHVMSAAKELGGLAKRHEYLLGQMVPAMQMVRASRFRYSAPLVPWTDAEMEDLHSVWLRVHKAAWWLTPSYAAAPFRLPSENGGCPEVQPRVILVQALAKHIEQLVALPDDLREETIARYRRLCVACGCHTARELTGWLATERKTRRCPISRFLRVCGQLGLEARLPACLSLGKVERETSWYALLERIRTLASAHDASVALKADVELVGKSWAAIRRRLRGRGMHQPRQLVILEASEGDRRPVWLLPETMSRRPPWLAALHRVLALVDVAALFPRLDRGLAVASVQPHQALMHRVIVGLRSADARVAPLFEDDRWNSSRSTAPLCRWHAILRRHKIESSVEADDVTHRSMAPIWDLLALGASPDVCRETLLKLVLWLAPSLRTAGAGDGDVEMRDRGPLMWAPVSIGRDLVEFQFRDPTAGTRTYGEFVVTTKDGLVRICEGQRHVGTIGQGRWGLLVSEYDADEVCRALPKWIAWVEQEETSRGVPSAQFLKGLKTALALDGIYGCCPLVAPSSFQKSISDWSRAEGWGQRLQSARPLYNLLCLTAPEQWHMCRNLRSDQGWYALTRSGTLGPQTKALLLRTGTAITVFRRGTQAAAVKGGWRQAKMGAVKTDADWTLWASHGAAGSVEAQAAQRERLRRIHLSADGVTPMDLSCPSAREAALGQCGQVYSYGGTVVAGDGSLKKDGSMGAAIVSLHDRVAAHAVAVFGPASSIRPELTAIIVALEDSPGDEELTLLTDSESSMTLLQSMQRRDFPLWLYRHTARQLLVCAANLINRRRARGVMTRFVKVKAHSGEPLNEAADALAGAAAEMDPSRPADVDPEGVYFYYRETLVVWSARLRQHLTQVAASQWAAKSARPVRRPDGSLGAPSPPLTTAWLLRPLQGRRMLGDALSRMKITPAKRQVLQTIAGTFPGNAIKFRWRLVPSPACSLCNHANESQVHIQCVCPALKGERIRVHHALATLLWSEIARLADEWHLHRELTVDGLRGIPVPIDSMDVWQRMCDELGEEDLVLPVADVALTSGIRRKRPDAWAVHWGRRVLYILEFTRPNDWADDWQTRTDAYKTERYTPLRDRIATLLPRWNIEIVTFSLGIRGSYNEPKWQTDLGRFEIKDRSMNKLMRELVDRCLTALSEIYKTRAAALRH